VRQPLQKVLIPVLNPAMKEQLQQVEDLIKAEVNVKEMEYLTDTEGFIKKKIKPNFIALGKKLGPKMKAVSAALSAFNQQDIATLERDGHIELPLTDGPITLQLNEVDIAAEDIPGWSVANKGALTVALDITLTDELKQEGDARELVNRIQNIRKDQGFELTDRVDVKLSANNGLQNSVNRFKNYICAEILADSISWVSEITDGTQIEINDHPIIVSVTKKEG
jgi:isoleucyl-tRNA synthetase